MPRIVYMPSTPLNVFVSTVLAIARKDLDSAELWLIDQKNIDSNHYFDSIKKWTDNPFLKIRIFSGQEKGWKKKQERHRNFKLIAQGLHDFQPEIIAVGSDRRLEFQYAMHIMKSSKKPAQGWYIDDGLYSYAGRPYHKINDNVNKLLKKLCYGFWWDEPKTIGASNWIDQAWLFKPEFSIAPIQKKTCSQLKPSWLTAPEIKNLSKSILSTYGIQNSKLAELEYLDILLLVPHPANLKKINNYADNTHNFIKMLHINGINIGIKYHPRTVEKDPLHFSNYTNTLLVPSEIAFEFILPFLKASTHIIGDISSALLTAQWLRPDIQVTALLDSANTFQNEFHNLYEALGIKYVEHLQDLTLSNHKAEL